MTPPIGLIGSEQALQGGLQGGVSALNAGNQGIDIQAALAGLRGNQAQGQAFQNFQQSPGQQFMRDQQEQALLRNSSAIGGLGGGNVRRELQTQAAGNAAQNFNNQFQQGQQVLGSQQALAPTAANLAFNTGSQLSQGRLGTSSALSNLLNQQGSGASDIIGGGSVNIANLLNSFGGSQAGSSEQLAQLLSNLSMQQSGQVASLPSTGQFLTGGGSLGGIGQLAGGIGGLMQGLG